MRVTLAGLGCGAMATVTAEVGEALAQADYLIGAARLLRRLPEELTPPAGVRHQASGDSGAAAGLRL